MFRDIAPAASHGTTRKARMLRRQMSLPEVLLWQRLRGAPLGCKFRRQHPSGAYFLDFYCADARLAIEVDGQQHAWRLYHDATRDAWFLQSGIVILRVAASDVLRDVDAAAAAIISAAVVRLPLHHPASPGGPPPRAKLGED